MNKAELRSHYKILRQKLLMQNKAEIEAKIISNLLPLLTNQNKIALFYPKDDELSLLALADKLKDSLILLPRISESKKVLDFCKASLRQEDLLLNSKYQIFEPNPDSQVFLPDVIIVPLLAFDKDNCRLGYGGGYYDATIAHLKSLDHKFLTVGVAHSQMQSENLLPRFATDQSLDYIVTENS